MEPKQRPERASQFAPFDALKGLREALAKKEKITVERKELSDEMLEELDRRLKDVRVRDIITVVYYHKEEYIQVTGMVARIDMDARLLQIAGTKIDFSDVCDIKMEAE